MRSAERCLEQQEAADLEFIELAGCGRGLRNALLRLYQSSRRGPTDLIYTKDVDF